MQVHSLSSAAWFQVQQHMGLGVWERPMTCQTHQRLLDSHSMGLPFAARHGPEACPLHDSSLPIRVSFQLVKALAAGLRCFATLHHVTADDPSKHLAITVQHIIRRLLGSVSAMVPPQRCSAEDCCPVIFSCLHSLCRFQHFVWLTSAVRGPYLPGYLDGTFPWYRLFTEPLGAGAKLVGATISCAPLIYSETVQLQFPHVQQVQTPPTPPPSPPPTLSSCSFPMCSRGTPSPPLLRDSPAAIPHV